jgi:hypothetical protein
MMHSGDLLDLFLNAEIVIENMTPHYPKKMVIHDEQVKEFLAYKSLKIVAMMKENGEI